MASIEPYETKGGRRYMVRYRTPDRRSATKRGFHSKRDANDWAAQNTVNMNTGAWRPDAVGRITVSSAARQWLEIKRTSVAAGTAANYSAGVNHIEKIGRLGNLYLKDVTPESVEDWIAELSKVVKPKTVHNSFGALNGVMKRAVRDRRLASNPCEGVQLPRVEKKDIFIPTVQDVERLAAAAGRNSEVIQFLAMTGLRWGEMAGLQVQDVNLETSRLRVCRQITEVGGKLVYGPPKHGKKRTVPLIARVVEILQSRVAGKSPDDLVFTTANGTVLRNRNARRDWFDVATVKAGLEGITPHDLRHTFASVAISAGANVKAIQQALGHHSAAFTLDQYGHLFPDDLGSFVLTMQGSFMVKCDQKVITGENERGQEG